MRYRGAAIPPWSHGTCCLYRLSLPQSLTGRVPLVRAYSTHQQASTPPPPPTNPTPPEDKGGAEIAKERARAALQHAGELGRLWAQQSARTASASANYWWARYEEFVGLNEVRGAQTKVTEAEAAFMVARGMVQESHGSLETLQVRLKEVRDRLDRVSREEAHYLELATLEHKLLQEERRLRTTYENSEGSEREKFSLFSAAVRESHDKERTRAERTKNWSIIGSVLGTLIGVMGSTYVNRVRLQELKNLLLEAQKGPVSLQEAIREQAGTHQSQQQQLRGLIDSLKATVDSAQSQRREDRPSTLPAPAPVLVPPPTPQPQPHPHPQPCPSDQALKELTACGETTQSLLQSLQPQIGQLVQGVGQLESELLAVRGLVETHQHAEKQAQEQFGAQLVRMEELVRMEPARRKEAARVEETARKEETARVEEAVRTQERVRIEEGVRTEEAAERLAWDSESVVKSVEETHRSLEGHISRTNVYNAVFTYTAAALTIPVLYLLLRGPG